MVFAVSLLGLPPAPENVKFCYFSILLFIINKLTQKEHGQLQEECKYKKKQTNKQTRNNRKMECIYSLQPQRPLNLLYSGLLRGV
jgi:flagellar biosynthesis component FlhA